MPKFPSAGLNIAGRALLEGLARWNPPDEPVMNEIINGGNRASCERGVGDDTRYAGFQLHFATAQQVAANCSHFFPHFENTLRGQQDGKATEKKTKQNKTFKRDGKKGKK